MVTSILIAVAVGYFLGAIPFGYLVARAKGVNIFEVGSRSSGATNVRRVLGQGPGALVLALDALKGVVAAGWPRIWTALATRDPSSDTFHALPDPTACMVAGLAGALLGHSFSCFTHFKGGKGVATGAGGFLVLLPIVGLVALAVWGLMLALTRYVSLASMIAAASLPVTAWLSHAAPLLVAISAAVMLFVIVNHRANVARLFAGTENKIGQKKAAPQS